MEKYELTNILAFRKECYRVVSEELVIIRAFVEDFNTEKIGDKFALICNELLIIRRFIEDFNTEQIGDKIALIYQELKNLEEQFNEFTKKKR